MSASSLTASAPAGYFGGEEKRVLAATLVGTAIEWYDYFIYAQAAGLVLGPLFFAPIARENPGLAQILSFATIGISFLFRPLGALTSATASAARLSSSRRSFSWALRPC